VLTNSIQYNMVCLIGASGLLNMKSVTVVGWKESLGSSVGMQGVTSRLLNDE